MKKLKFILPALAFLLTATSCVIDDEVDQQYEQSPYVVGFLNDFAAESYFEDEGVVEKNYAVDILGGSDGSLPTEDIVVSYEIDPASTATEGQEFNFVDNSGTLTIPAGSTFANFPLEINTGNLDPNEPTELILNLTGTNSDNAVVSALNDQFSITFVGCQSTVDENTYVVNTYRVSTGALVKSGIENITMNSVNDFRTMSTGAYGPDSAGGPIAPPANYNGFNFIDICGEISVPSQNLGGYYSNQVFGSGSVDADGNIEIIYTITFAAGDQVFRSEYEVQ